MLYVVLYVADRNGQIKPININPSELKKDELLKLIKSYKNLVRVAIECIINNRPFFRYNLRNVDSLKDIEFFTGYGVSTTTYNTKPMSAGFIDKNNNVRVEYLQDGIRMYQLK